MSITMVLLQRVYQIKYVIQIYYVPRDFSVIYFSVISMLQSGSSNRTFLRPQIKHTIKTKKDLFIT